tara:strand:- start:1056 stop:2093 length:1038 start_codon:yes stop_codon:yes gene_type:complete
VINKNKIIILSLFSTIIIINFCWILYLPNISVGHKKLEFYIKKNTSFTEFLKDIDPYLTSKASFKLASKLKKFDKNVKPGRYIIEKSMSNNQLINNLRVKNIPIKLTFNNLERIENLASVISKQLEVDSLNLINQLLNGEFLKENGFNPNNALSMYIPNTYELFWNTSSVNFQKRMYREYLKFWNKKRLSKAREIDLTPIQVSILASIINKESNINEERPIIAGVYLNRIQKNIKLQADPTVIYSIKQKEKNFKKIIKRVLFRDLNLDSEYNTYRYFGLPPGPICMPDISSIDAVLNYKKHDYLYFVANPYRPGYHSFSKNLIEHNNYRRLYLNWLRKKNYGIIK